MPKQYRQEVIQVPKFEEAQGFYTTKKRSEHMAKIKGKDTKPELALRKALHRKGIRYRVHVKQLPGSPDVANISKRFVVFIDGEFWHGFNWEEKKGEIKSNRGFWIPKIERNRQRDAENNEALEKMGFKVFRFWESQVKKDIEGCVGQVAAFLADGPRPKNT
jgi:DNA mismatch endonuclease, patch repair protein